MSCAILNTMKLCISQAQTDISGEKVPSYIYGVTSFFHNPPLSQGLMVGCFNWKKHGIQTELETVVLIKRNVILIS